MWIFFAGPGVCIERDSRTEFAGSPIEALKCRTPFTHFFFNDIDEDSIDALSTRQTRMHPQAKVEYLKLDCNEAARQIAGLIPRNCSDTCVHRPMEL